jgi:hypothetical protein
MDGREGLIPVDQWRAQRGLSKAASPERIGATAPRMDGRITPEGVKVACKLAGLPESFGTDMLAEGKTPDEALMVIAHQQKLSERMSEKFGKRGGNG